MQKLTFYDINKILERLADSKSSGFDLSDFLEPDNENETSLANMIANKFFDDYSKIGSFEKVWDNGADMDGYGDVSMKKVFYFKDHDVYVQFKGSWSSYNGIQFESCKEVKPVTKTITVYE